MASVSMLPEAEATDGFLSSDVHGTSLTNGRQPSASRYSSRTSTNAAIDYNPRNPLDHRPRQPAIPAFPTPHIRPRQRRPHTIHILSYPPGYIPTELRSSLQPDDTRSARKGPASKKAQDKHKAQNLKRGGPKNKRSAHFLRKASPATSLIRTASSPGSRALGKLLSAFFITQPSSPCPATPGRKPPKALPAPTPQDTPRPTSLISLGRRLSRSQSHTSDIARDQPRIPIQPPVYEQVAASSSSAPMSRSPVVVEALRQDHHHGSAGTQSNRNSFMSVRSSVKNIMTSSVLELAEKPIASGGGLSCTIFLAEPNVFLSGFDHDGHTSRSSNNGTALLRGKLQLIVTKNIKIRAVTLKLHGTARTEWPEGIPPLKIDASEEESLRTQALTFFHAMHESWETPYGNQCTYSLKSSSDILTSSLTKRSATNGSDNSSASTGMTAKDIKRLSLQQVQTRSFGKGDSPLAHPVQAKGYKVFAPGAYDYSFELPIDHHQLETIRLPYGCVKWDLEATVERAGAFKPNLHGAKEVNIIRVPDQLSLETVEPISISRQWEDQLFYDIVISGKSFPIGGKIPIAFKLTPLAKVQLHRLKVFVTESAEYWTNNRRVTRKDTGHKILLFEKSAGKPLDEKYASSEISYLRGGELSPSERAEARATATRRREMEAAGTSNSPAPLPEPSDNLLGDLDLGLETYWGATEIEMNVQIPTCDQMAKDPALRLHPDCSWRNANVYHWIKVVMRISRLDADDPEGKRRRHFEISIDSPFTILSCLATQSNIALPQYSGMNPAVVAQYRTSATCGCHDAPGTPTPTSRTTSFDMSLGSGSGSGSGAQHMPMPPQAAHLQAQSADSPSYVESEAAGGLASNFQDRQRSAHSDQEEAENPRPIHLLRVPSFAPPAFDADESPPIPMDITTPPPNYDAIIGTPSVDGLADYFSRLATYEHPDAAIEDDSDSDSDNMHMPTRIASRGGRVNVRTPGARHGPSRSMDIERPTIPIHLSMASVLRRNAE